MSSQPGYAEHDPGGEDNDERDDERGVREAVGRDRAEVDTSRGEEQRDGKEQTLRDDVGHRSKEPAGRDGSGEADPLLPEKPDLHRGAADRRHRQVRERHCDLDLGGRPERKPDRHRPHQRDREPDVGHQRQHECTDQPARLGVPHGVPQRVETPDLREQHVDGSHRRNGHQEVRGAHPGDMLECRGRDPSGLRATSA